MTPLISRPALRQRCIQATTLAAACLLLTPFSIAQQQPAFQNTLMPVPSQLTVSSGSIPLTKEFTVSLSGSHNHILEDATRRTLDAIELHTGVQLSKEANASSATLTIQVQDASTTRPTLDADESYSLATANNKIVLQAKTVFGALHGLVTLQQLLQVENGAYVIPAVQINDSPRFAWRGLMIDTGRHFMPLPVIYRTLDGMAAVKLNVFHWHLTEDQGFRIESKRFPKLTGLGSDGLFYTQDQVREVIRYASARGIRIVPEFDVPGHVTSWLVGYPELSSKKTEYKVGRDFGVWDGALDPTKESTYKFLDEFIGEMADLFPDEYMHMGGDESNGKDWKANPQIVAYMQQHNIKTTDELQAYFSTRVLALIKKHNKQLVGWDEILQPNTPKDAVIQSWRGVESLATAAKQGNRGILSAPYYLDGMKSSEKMYLDDPIPDGSTLTAAEQKLILGGETCMWAEQITGQTVDSRIWPRTAAIAERFWSPKDVRNVDDLYRRLDVESLRLDALGLTHISGPESGLRQLAGSEEGAEQLSGLTSVLQPVSFPGRYNRQHTNQLTPMGSLVDYTRPDPSARQNFRLLVDRYLQTANPAEHDAARQQLESLFHTWIATRPALDLLAADRPLVNEIKLRREELPQLAILGIESLGFIESHNKPSSTWTEQQNALLKRAAEHVELVDFVVLPPLQQLVEATGKQ